MSLVNQSRRINKSPSAHVWQRRLYKVSITVLLMGFTLMVIIPFVWMLLMSFRTTAEILQRPYGLPSELRWDNYTRLLFDPRIRFYRNFVNSIYVTGFAIILSSILAALGGYGFGRPRYGFRFRSLLFTMLLFGLMLPPQILYLPQFAMMSSYGLLNTRWSLILLYTAGALPVSIFLMSTYFAQLPGELEDAARIDGCTDWGTFWRVMLPLARPALLTVILLNFIYFWNELLLAVTMVTKPELRTLPSAMMMFVGEHGSNYGLAAASLVTAMAPILLLYLFMSEKFIQGLTAGAVKGGG